MPSINNKYVYNKGNKRVGTSWYNEKEAATTFDDTTINFDDIKELFVKWETGNFDIVYDATGKIEASSVTYSKDSAANFNLDEVTFTKVGYTLKGWDVVEYVSTVVYKLGEALSAGFSEPDNTKKLYGVWEEKKYTIEYFDTDGTTEITSLKTENVKYTDIIKVKQNPNIPTTSADDGYNHQGTTDNKVYANTYISLKNDLTINVTDTEVNLLSKALDDYYAINGVHYAILDANGGNFIEYDTAGVEVNVATKKVRIKATESTAKFT